MGPHSAAAPWRRQGTTSPLTAQPTPVLEMRRHKAQMHTEALRTQPQDSTDVQFLFCSVKMFGILLVESDRNST